MSFSLFIYYVTFGYMVRLNRLGSPARLGNAGIKLQECRHSNYPPSSPLYFSFGTGNFNYQFLFFFKETDSGMKNKTKSILTGTGGGGP